MELDQFEGHTPGPLACVELMAFAAGFAVEDGEGRTVARIMKTHGVERLPSRANAALFAAAPELLAEVRRLTAEADALRRERDDLAARLAKVEQAEPVAWVPMHPRFGALWAMTTATPSEERLPSHYPLSPLYASSAPAAAPSAGATDQPHPSARRAAIVSA